MMTKMLKKYIPTTLASEEVESNEELVMAILVRLPVKPIFKFKCISKRWKDMLNDPYFYKSCIRVRDEQLCGNGVGRLLAFFQDKIRFHGPGPHQLFHLLPIPQPSQNIIKQLPFVNTTFVHCTDGLILFQKKSSKYLVVNPVNRTWVKLPKPNFDELETPAITCQENKVNLMPSFRVVGIARNYDKVEPKAILIDTYSSENGEWKVSKLACTRNLYYSNWWKQPFVYNGVFHWFITLPGHRILGLAVYDSNGDKRYIQFIELPLDFNIYCFPNFVLTRSPRDNVLWVGLSSGKKIKFWRLPKRENGSYKRRTTVTEDKWILMHKIDNVSESKEMTLLESKKRRKSIFDEAVANPESYLKLEALIPRNPLLAVLSLQHKVFLYNLETKSAELVMYRGRPLGGKPSPDWHPFLESPYLSTYAPLERSYD